jgi:type VI secretion system VasD/TssJ family lipoprotein
MTKIILCCILISIIMSLSACAVYPITTELQSSAILNFDEHYQSLPVKIHIYQLTENEKFINASFYDLWKHPESTLGPTLIKHQSITLNPGEKQTLKTKRKKGANFIAAMAVFRKPSTTHWKVYKKLPKAVPYIPTRLLLGLTENRIYIK